MTVRELAESCSFGTISLVNGEHQVSGAYIGDLLSWVMGRASADNAWITIMSNINVIAVASLSDVSCVIFAEGVTPDDDIVSVAKEKGINLLCSELPTYETAVKISEFLK